MDFDIDLLPHDLLFQHHNIENLSLGFAAETIFKEARDKARLSCSRLSSHNNLETLYVNFCYSSIIDRPNFRFHIFYDVLFVGEDFLFGFGAYFFYGDLSSHISSYSVN